MVSTGPLHGGAAAGTMSGVSCARRSRVARCEPASHGSGACSCLRVHESEPARTRGPCGKLDLQPGSRAGTGSEDSGGDVVAFAGRLVREKGLDVLLRALRSIPDARLHVAGDGPLREEWERLAEALGVAQRSRSWARYRLRASPISTHDRRSSVFRACGGKPFGYSAAEAMAVGRAVVGLPTGSLPELLAAGRGFVANDVSSTALASALREALGDSDARRRAGVAAREFAQREFAPDVVGPRYLQIYEQ